MKKLYEFFDKGESKNQEGKEQFSPQYKERVFRSLGLFLFSYLANGANLADIAKLRYDDFYFNHAQKAMRFIRQKTMRETDGMEVIVSCENSNTADRMEVVMTLLNMEEKPSPTWCRHSYATNLRDAGVPTEYISTMMGHTMTSGSATTLNYLARYNMATMVAYNSKLLNNGESEKREEILDKLKEMDTEKLAAFLKLMS